MYLFKDLDMLLSMLKLVCGAKFEALPSTQAQGTGAWLQRLLKEKCMSDEKLFASFLNRLFNTLNWTITEFSVAIKEMQEHSDLRQVLPFYIFLVPTIFSEIGFMKNILSMHNLSQLHNAFFGRLDPFYV